MKVVYEVCCGIDVHAKMLVACLIGADGTKQIRTYSTMTDDLLKLHEWLVAAGCTQVAIESTGVYWKPVFNVLEDALTVILVNPERAGFARSQDRRQRRGVVGRLAAPRPAATELHPAPRDSRVAGVDALSREPGGRTGCGRQSHPETDRVGQHQTGTSSHGCVGRLGTGDVAGFGGRGNRAEQTGRSGGWAVEREASVAYPRAAWALDHGATVGAGRIARPLERIGNSGSTVIKEIDQQLQSPAHPRLARAREILDTIPGLGPRVVEVAIAEAGVQMREVFPTDAHLASWAGLCPGTKASGGKRLSGRTRKGNTYLRAALVQAAWGVTRKKNCYLSAQYYRLVKRLGKKKALIAVAHSLLVIIYHVLERDQSYTELGGDYFDRRNTEQQRAYHIRRLQMLGLKVNIEELPTAA